MRRLNCLTLCAISAASLTGCGWATYPIAHYEAVYTKTTLSVPAPDVSVVSHMDSTRVNRGRYLTVITGCAACHTDGALVGDPNPSRSLAGSQIGIAYTNPFSDPLPGVAFPGNLTPDAMTGLGRWTDEQIATAIRAGNPRDGAAPSHLAVMPWPLLAQLTDDDANAIVAYLRSIPPIEHHVPARAPPGTRASADYVYHGVFRSGPVVSPPAAVR